MLQSKTNNQFNFYRTPEGKHLNAPFLDPFTTFTWRGIDSWREYGCFILNDGEELKWLGQETSNEYSAPLFGSNSQTILSTTFNASTFSLRLGLYAITGEEYRAFFKWLNPLVIDHLFFRYDPIHYYNVKSSSITETTKYIIGYTQNQPLYYAETTVTFELQGELCAWDKDPILWTSQKVDMTEEVFISSAGYDELVRIFPNLSLQDEDPEYKEACELINNKYYPIAYVPKCHELIEKAKTAYTEALWNDWKICLGQPPLIAELQEYVWVRRGKNATSPVTNTTCLDQTSWLEDWRQHDWISDLRNSIKIQFQIHQNKNQIPLIPLQVKIVVAPLLYNSQYQTIQWDNQSELTLCNVEFDTSTPEWVSFVYDSVDGLLYRTIDKKLLTLTFDGIVSLQLNKFLLPSRLEDQDFYVNEQYQKIRDVGVRIFINNENYGQNNSYIEQDTSSEDNQDVKKDSYIEIHSYLKTPLI